MQSLYSNEEVHVGSRRRISGRKWFGAGLIWFVFVTFSILSAASASAQPPPDQTANGPKIAVTPGQLVVNLHSITDSQRPRMLSDVGTIRPVIMNTGTMAGTITLSVSLDQELGSCRSSAVVVKPATVTVNPVSAQVTPLDLWFPAGCTGQTGTLILNVAGGQPATATVSVLKDFSEIRLWLPILWLPILAGGLSGILFIAIMFLLRLGRLKDEIHVGPSWSFTDSWLTNVSTFGGSLAIVLAATGFLKFILRGMPTDRLIGLNVLFATLVLVAPIIYSINSRWGYETVSSNVGQTGNRLGSKGTGWGVVCAAAVTLAGVTGQLGTLALIDYAAQDAGEFLKWILFLLLAAGDILVFWYAIAFSYGITKPDPKPPANKKYLQSEVSATL